MTAWTKGQWSRGPVEWDAGDTVYLSVVFTWHLDQAFARALFWRALGKRVIAGGPALFLQQMKHEIEDVAEVGGVWDVPDAVSRHNPMATNASYGCPADCHVPCIVPAMHGRQFTLAPDFTPRPVLCDNNLSALPAEYQDHIISRYTAARVPLLDANSGFEPATFDEKVYRRWKVINRGPWRFGYDETRERDAVYRVTRMLKDEPPKRKRVYVMIGNEPVAACMQRIEEAIAWGCEPHVQPVIKLNAIQKRPWVRFDWTERLLQDVARWANGRYFKYTGFDGYVRYLRSAPYVPEQKGLFA